jgi:ribonuclease P protein component
VAYFPCNGIDKNMYELLKKRILKKNKHFQAVYRHGKSFANRYMVLYVLKSRCEEGRVGFAAGKRLGNAVVRNRVKRLLREAYRLNRNNIAVGFDLIIVGRQAVIDKGYTSVEDSFIKLCRQAGIVKD